MATSMSWQNEKGENTATLPDWVPKNVAHYVAHTELGVPIRALARSAGCHASTILRQIRKVETQRDDPLVDAALRHLGEQQTAETILPMSKLIPNTAKPMPPKTQNTALPEPDDLASTSRIILRRLCEKGAVLAVAAEMEKAVVVRDGEGITGTRTAIVDRGVAEAMALKDWISAQTTGKITRYRITAKGRAALAELMAGEESSKANTVGQGLAEAPGRFDPIQDRRPTRRRYSLAESPLTALARRKDKGGESFLDDSLVRAGERLREDFELGQTGPQITQNWDNFLTTHDRTAINPSGPSGAPSAARTRVAAALEDLGPGLADVALRCCCFLEGLETTEKRLGWSARSGKIVLRIALLRLKRHYAENANKDGNLIG